VPLREEKCFRMVILAIITISALIVAIGFYIGFALKNIVLLASTLVLIILSLSLLSEFTGLFKDRLNEKELKLALSLDPSKLKKNIN
jgi:hypothetical protein